MAQILDVQGLQHYANKMCNADNRKVGTKSLPTTLNDIDTAIDGFEKLFATEYGAPINMKITNNENLFPIGTGANIDKRNDIQNSFTNLTMNGNSLVNIVKAKNITLNAASDSTRTLDVIVSNIKPSTVYTFIVFVYSNTADTRLRMTTSSGFPFLGGVPIAELKKTGVFVTKMTSEPSFSVNKVSFNVTLGSGQVNFSCVLLEGDYTNKAIPNYFEDLKSIGEQNNEIHKIGITSKGKNLIDFSMENIENFHNSNFNFTQMSNNAIRVRSNYEKAYGFKKGFYVKKGEQYTITVTGMKENSNDYSAMYLGDTTLNYFQRTFILIPADTAGNIINTSNSFSTKSVTMTALRDGYINRWLIHSFDQGNYYQIKSIQIEKGNAATTFESCKSDEKEILLNEPLRGLPNGIKDSIEQVNGEWKIIRRCKQETLTGNSLTGFTLGAAGTSSSIGASVNRIDFILSNAKWQDNKNNTVLVCDKFAFLNFHASNNGSKERDSEAICFHSNNAKNINLHIWKTRMSAQTADAARSWLNSNPIKIIYELEKYVVEDIDPITLQCWKNGTITIDEAIPVETTHTVALNRSAQIQNNIENLTELKNRVKKLQEQYNKTALNQAYEVELLKLDMKLDNII